ncbi:Putative C6 zinc finger domain protein [Aspergillus calidoustus]|uniref:Putative C6 zinc finger domain protein n=1 Tax=Aspergillus calidoustus TaxID=454130 RepID=A0A0U5GFX0_ASPCI|nr:Putative C6 zinc finger domain protein [Aspergillus calidoustus]
MAQIPPAPQEPTPNGEFRCGICHKTYGRRDLRDRHRRRCIKSIGQERLSKRKSCETCAQKKLRCSMTRPACTRCLQIGIHCQYPASAVPQPQDGEAPSATPGDPGTIQPSLLENPSHPFEQTLGDSWTPFAPASADPLAGAFADASFANPGISWNEEFSNSSHSLGQDEEILASMTSNSTSSPGSLFPLPDPNRAPESVPSEIFNTGSSIGDATQQRYTDSPYVDFSLDSSAQLIFGRRFLPKIGSLTPYDIQELNQQMLDVLREYPSLILQRDHWSPFVHHRMYRCSMGGMAKPMGVALACVSAHAGSSGSNYGFVDGLINQQREQLIREFQSYLDTPENCLAAVHAVCIYQILGLFGDNFLPAAIKATTNMKSILDQRRTDCERQAELHSSFLLKMTRRLYKHYRAAVETNHDDELNWERWKFSESIRRNIFFANIINILGARAGKLNGVYFEPLDDDVILNLTLPAPECMWRACSLREWLDARKHALRMSPAPQEGHAPRLTQTLQELLNDEAAGTLDVSGLLPLTRVILASTKIAPSGFGL